VDSQFDNIMYRGSSRQTRLDVLISEILSFLGLEAKELGDPINFQVSSSLVVRIYTKEHDAAHCHVALSLSGPDVARFVMFQEPPTKRSKNSYFVHHKSWTDVTQVQKHSLPTPSQRDQIIDWAWKPGGSGDKINWDILKDSWMRYNSSIRIQSRGWYEKKVLRSRKRSQLG